MRALQLLQMLQLIFDTPKNQKTFIFIINIMLFLVLCIQQILSATTATTATCLNKRTIFAHHNN